jgi:sec-independent protein translocase protein TatB
MFDISWGKIVIIGVVALIFIGPKELPAVLRMVGQWMGKMRRMAAEFQGQFQDAMREAEMADLKKTFDETTSGLASVFDPIKNDMDKMVNDPMSAGSASTATPDAGIPTPEPSVPADPVALGTAPVAPPEVSVPSPEMPPPVETKDFAAPATPAPDLAQAAPPAGGAPASAPAPEAGGGKAA